METKGLPPLQGRARSQETIMSDVFQFMKLSRNPGEKVEAAVRKIEFKEIYQPLHKVDAADQAGRCLSCGNPIANGNARYTTTFPTG
jgi:hypothetical protein